MWNLNNIVIRCGLCKNGAWFGRFVTLKMVSSDGDHDMKVCKECNKAIEYWQERTLLRAGKVEVAKE